MTAGRRILGVAAILAGLTLGGCTSVPVDQNDPFEPLNRTVYSFNDTLDRALLAPIADAYRRYLPEGVRDAVFNFFDNVGYPVTAANQLLQGKPTLAIEDAARFLFNSTLGIGGLFDVSSGFGLERHDEDFGQTLGVWGTAAGPHLELPLLGPSSVRDAIALPVDVLIGIGRHADGDLRIALKSVEVIDTRARVDAAVKLRDEAAIDPYIFQREAYRQRRRSLIYDGNPPIEDLDLEQ